MDFLTSELSKVSNIKSKQVRHDVERAIKCGLYQLKNCKVNKVPENGWVLCAGVVIETGSLV